MNAGDALTTQDVFILGGKRTPMGEYVGALKDISAVEHELGLDREKTNVNRGAIALGHPLGATGTRLVLTLLRELQRRAGRYGLAAACIGDGQSIAIICERM